MLDMLALFNCLNQNAERREIKTDLSSNKFKPNEIGPCSQQKQAYIGRSVKKYIKKRKLKNEFAETVNGNKLVFKFRVNEHYIRFCPEKLNYFTK